MQYPGRAVIQAGDSGLEEGTIHSRVLPTLLIESTEVRLMLGLCADLRDKVDDAENRSRAYNLRFIHIPEKSEGKDTCGFISCLIQQLFGKESFPTPPAIERAHRSPMIQSTDNVKPRAIIVKCLSLLDRQKILRLARAKKQLEHNGDRIHIFPDFSAALLSKRRQFDDIKKQLQQRNIEYSLIYPATLKIIFNGKPVLFKTSGEAKKFLEDALTANAD